MDRKGYSFGEAESLQSMKNELKEYEKDKESEYNFDFANEQIKQGRFLWEITEVSKNSCP